MAISKVILNGVTQMDVTQDTVTAADLKSGITATAADGIQITGSFSPISYTNLVSTNSSLRITGEVFLENTGIDVIGYAFYKQAGITKLHAPYITGTSGDGYCFYSCTGLTEIDCPLATGFGQACFRYCSGLTTVVLPSGFHNWSYTFANCTNLTIIDFAGITGTQGTFAKQGFDSASKLSTVIIRNTVVPKLDNINAFSATPFASGKAGGTLYVPEDLIASYQTASNWSTILGYATNSIQKIEGSIYDGYYADGTAIPSV